MFLQTRERLLRVRPAVTDHNATGAPTSGAELDEISLLIKLTTCNPLVLVSRFSWPRGRYCHRDLVLLSNVIDRERNIGFDAGDALQ